MYRNSNGIGAAALPLWTVTAFADDGRVDGSLVGTATASDLDAAAGLVCSYLPVPEHDSVGYYFVATRTRPSVSRLTEHACVRSLISKPSRDGAVWTTGPWSAQEELPRA